MPSIAPTSAIATNSWTSTLPCLTMSTMAFQSHQTFCTLMASRNNLMVFINMSNICRVLPMVFRAPWTLVWAASRMAEALDCASKLRHCVLSLPACLKANVWCARQDPMSRYIACDFSRWWPLPGIVARSQQPLHDRVKGHSASRGGRESTTMFHMSASQERPERP